MFQPVSILLIGSGGRECALAWKLSQSPFCLRLFIAPGNGGTEQFGLNVPLNILDATEVIRFCQEKEIGLVVVGPEEPLVNGLSDEIRRNLPEVLVIGPGAAGARLEGSKAFAKRFMADAGIPTASYREFRQDQLREGLEFLAQCKVPIVLKADGLAAGKGVLICQSREEAASALQEMFSGKFGKAGETVLIEEFLSGIEFSVFILTNGTQYALFPEAKDYKRVGEGDTGLNTGGMGAISPVPFFDEALRRKTLDRIVHPTLDQLSRENIPYTGFIFFGLIAVDGEPYVIEYNCRLGDPETEAIIPRLNSDLVELFYATCNQGLSPDSAGISDLHTATVMLTAAGYPGDYEKGKEIQIVGTPAQCLIFHAGTKKVAGVLQTHGGRVIAVTGLGETGEQALKEAYQGLSGIQYPGRYYRRDIGYEFYKSLA